jgi:phosphohistidine swiveling domain-containing protein
MELKPSNYNGLFKMRGHLTCLHSEFLVKGSLGLGGALVICKGKDWRSFINKEGEKKCQKKGYEIFSNDKKYRQYKRDFNNYIEVAKKEIIPRYKDIKEKIKQPEFKKMRVVLSKFWYYYGLTEFPYHDLACQKLSKNKDKVLKKNLEDLGKLKFKGREILNALVFEDGVLINLLRNVSNQFYKKNNNAFLLFGDELEDLFDLKKVPNKILKERSKYYGCAFLNNRFKILSYKEAEDVWTAFCENIENNEIIFGKIANSGIAKGKVVIAPMLVNLHEIKKIDIIMKKGDILVAESTTPELMMLCKKASAIVTDQGGMLSHAAIVSRELNIPCIIGTGNATQILKNGALVKVDANIGKIIILNKLNN